MGHIWWVRHGGTTPKNGAKKEGGGRPPPTKQSPSSDLKPHEMAQNGAEFGENEAPGMFLKKSPRSGIGFGPPGPQNHTRLKKKLKLAPPKKSKKKVGGGGVPT